MFPSRKEVKMKTQVDHGIRNAGIFILLVIIWTQISWLLVVALLIAYNIYVHRIKLGAVLKDLWPKKEG